MLVKKLNPDWKPSENPDLAVGETIDITDPKSLIIEGSVVGLGKNGETLSAYELYGVLVKAELDEYEEFLKIKKATSLKSKLEAEAVELEAKAVELETIASVAPVVAPTRKRPTLRKKK